MDDIDRLMTAEERMELIAHIARHPGDGKLIPGTGGARKLRWARTGEGKRGGYRVITFFHNRSMPVFMIAIFGKNERADLAQAEKNALRGLFQQIVAEYAGRRSTR